MDVLKSAEKFARNPLGIIALFISLIYGFANLLLSSSVTELTSAQRWPIIMFIVGFPLVVLGTFYKLVTNHHGKLYAPGDFKNDRAFLTTLSSEKLKENLDNEVTETIRAEESAEEILPAKNDAPTATPERISFHAFREELSFVEDAVIRKISSELNLPAEKGVGIADTEADFDAFLGFREKATFIEVKAVRRPMIGSAFLDRTLYNAVLANQFFGEKFRLILAIVYFFTEEDLPRFEQYLRRRIEKCPVEIDLRLINRNTIVGPNKAAGDKD